VSAPVQPVTLDVRELTAIKTALTEKARELRDRADRRRDLTAFNTPAILREQARKYEDIAARLSFAVPGEPIQVVDVVA
jgi:hypothetical protein